MILCAELGGRSELGGQVKRKLDRRVDWALSSR